MPDGVNFQKSLVYGMTSPSCGDNCDCSNCSSVVEECEGDGCAGFVSSVEKIQCQRDGCVKSNETKYYMMPLYPVSSSLPYYNPKFKFIKIFSPQTIENTPENISIYKKQINPNTSTLPPEIHNLESMVLFGVSYPSLELFDTEDKFIELLVFCKMSSVLLSLLKQDEYVKHNNAVLQEIIKVNKLPSTLINQDIMSISDTSRDSVNKRETEWRMQMQTKVKTIPPNILDKSYEKRVKAHYQKQLDARNIPFDPNRLNMSVVEPPTGFPMEVRVKEGYDDIPLKKLVVPVSVQDNDTIPDSPKKLLVETSKTSTATPSSKKKMSVLNIIGIIVILIIVDVVLYLVFSRKSKNK